MMDEAVEVLEAQPPGPELVSAYAYWGGRGLFTRDTARVLDGAEKALALAAELGLPEPAFAVHVRGCGREGEEGIEDLRRALQLGLEQGLGRETAVIYGNLALAIYEVQGPQAALAAYADANAFCERRGIVDVALQNRSVVPEVLSQLGRTEEALSEARRIAGPLEASRDMAWIDMRALQVQLLAEIGSPEPVGDVAELVQAARETQLPAFIGTVLGAVAKMLIAGGRPEQACATLRELDELGYVPVPQLRMLVGMALAFEEQALAERFVGRVDSVAPLARHMLTSARAQLAEGSGDPSTAARLYEEAAEGWTEFGHVPERAYALLGRGRCLVALDDPAAGRPLAEARDLFASMGYRPALAETEALLDQAQTAAM
jgi:tetratricopeptide (TPR) repeat protein